MRKILLIIKKRTGWTLILFKKKLNQIEIVIIQDLAKNLGVGFICEEIDMKNHLDGSIFAVKISNSYNFGGAIFT